LGQSLSAAKFLAFNGVYLFFFAREVLAKRLLSQKNTFALLAKSGAIPEVHVRDIREIKLPCGTRKFSNCWHRVAETMRLAGS